MRSPSPPDLKRDGQGTTTLVVRDRPKRPGRQTLTTFSMADHQLGVYWPLHVLPGHGRVCDRQTGSFHRLSVVIFSWYKQVLLSLIDFEIKSITTRQGFHPSEWLNWTKDDLQTLLHYSTYFYLISNWTLLPPVARILVSESFQAKICRSIHCNMNGYLFLSCVYLKRPGPGWLSRVTRDRVQIQSGMAAGFNLRLRGSLLNKRGSVSSWGAAHAERDTGPKHSVCACVVRGKTCFICLKCLVFITSPHFLAHPPDDIRKKWLIGEIFDEMSRHSSRETTWIWDEFNCSVL